jgi:hypothetical protein
MMRSIVLQSHRDPLPHAWLKPCLQSVRDWATHNDYTYRFVGDELFDGLDASILRKTGLQIVIATDLARLIWMRRLLDEGYQQVIWCDADFLIFAPERFKLLDESCAVGREVWIQHDEGGRLKAYRKVHNAFLMFRQGSALLDFYIETASRLLARNQGGMPPQFIGPKLLTALHNVAQFPVQEDAAMFSPLLIEDQLKGGGEPSALFTRKSACLPSAANLCCSSVDRGEIDDARMSEVIRLLQRDGLFVAEARAGQKA